MRRITRMQLLAFLVFDFLLVMAVVWFVLPRGESGPGLVFLLLDERRLEDLWIVQPDNPDSLRRLTQTRGAILDFDTASDASVAVCSLRDLNTGAADLYRLDIESGETTRLTDCAITSSVCHAPAIAPGEQWVAYERSPGMDQDAPGEIWLLDMTADPPATFPLLTSGTATGRGIVWSADGTNLAYYDENAGGIIVLDFATRDEREPQTLLVPAQFNLTGVFSPDGTLLVYPDMIFSEDDLLRSFLQAVDLETGRGYILSDPGAGGSDLSASWSPDGRYLAIGRANTNEGGANVQVYLWETATETIRPLVTDPLIHHSHMTWSPDSQWLAMMRLPQADASGRLTGEPVPEVWVYHLAEDRLIQIAEQARLPHWVP